MRGVPDGRRTLAAAWLGLVLVMAVLGGRGLDVPGPYYDEVIQALPAIEFLDASPRGLPLPGSSVIPVAGRPFPWMTQAYMGALKSQLLIPVFAAASDDLRVLRLTTLAWSAFGLLLCMAFAWRAFGLPVALISGRLLVSDPSFVFLSRHDWGSFPLGLLLRCASLWLALLWWEGGRLRHAILAGAALGLGVYNKIDFALFPVAGAAALLVGGRHIVVRAAGERRGQAIALVAVALVLVLPIAVGLPVLLGAAGRLEQQVALSEKLLSLWAVLDGSYFLRLMQVGGRFDAMHALEGVPRSALGLLFLGSLAGLGVAAVRRRAPSGVPLLLLCGLFLAVLHLGLPGGARAHHLMNLYPFPHWISAVGLVALWGGARSSARTPRRAAALAIALGLMIANVLVVRATHGDLARSGGRGNWSDAIVAFAKDVAATPEARVVCLDWGLHNPVVFLTEGVPSLDGVWSVRRALARGEVWSVAGDAGSVYLVHPEAFDLFGLSGRFRAAVDRLPAERVEVRAYRDRESEEAFLALRLLDRHQVVYDGRGFRIALERPAAPDAPAQ
jgi:hypothetical protein